jgi:hypothetical protein
VNQFDLAGLAVGTVSLVPAPVRMAGASGWPMTARLSVAELMAAPCRPGVRLAWKEASRCGKSLYWLVPRSAMLSGSHTRAVSPCGVPARSRTRTPCRSARRATANSPMCLDTDSSIAGGSSSRRFISASLASETPTPLSLTWISTPPLPSSWTATST